MPARRFIKDDPEELATYIKSLGHGLVVFDGRPTAGKSFMVRATAERIRCEWIDADPFVHQNEEGVFFGALRIGEMQSLIHACLATSPLVLLSTILARRVVERLKIPAVAFVWVESMDDYNDPSLVDIDALPPLRAAVEKYLHAFTARDRADVLYVNAVDD